MASIPQHSGRGRGRALIIEGGGMRGAFTGGVLSAMSQHHPAHNFDLVVAVSAGACSAAYYVTEHNPDPGELNRSLGIWRYELAGSRLMSYRNIFRGKRFLNQEYLIDELFGERFPIKREMLAHKKTTPLYIALTNLKTHKVEFHRANPDNILALLKAATSLPLATAGKREFNGGVYTDGGVLAPLPIRETIEAGYKDITVVLTNHRHFRIDKVSGLLARLCFPKHPGMARQFKQRHHRLNNFSYELANNPPPGVRVRIIDPPGDLPATMLETDPVLLNRTVDIGLSRAYEHFPDRARTNRIATLIRSSLSQTRRSAAALWRVIRRLGLQS